METTAAGVRALARWSVPRLCRERINSPLLPPARSCNSLARPDRNPARKTLGGDAMLGRLILFLLQIVVGWFGTNAIMSAVKLGQFSQFSLFIYAVLAAIVVYLIGNLGAQVLKEVGEPSNRTLSAALVMALIAAAAATWGPQFVPAISQVPDKYLVLAGAILGYTLKK